MTENPNNNPDGPHENPDKKKGVFYEIAKATTKTRDAIAAVLTHPSTLGAVAGTFFLPGVGTVIGAMVGSSFNKGGKKSSDAHH